ncbi:MAG: ATP-binding protein [Candidatus Eremiobacteraeota bacterium]|nr:ATP-binding protein [Candidatus Eremiobacteraeota bacterium]
MIVSGADSATLETVELRIPRKAEWVAVARLAAAAVASRMHFTIEEIEDVKLAVAEACTNAIQSADAANQIQIVCEADHAHLRVTVTNTNIDGAPAGSPPALAEDDGRVDGLGVFLIRSLMDDVEYDVHPERGTHLVMVKRLAS